MPNEFESAATTPPGLATEVIPRQREAKSKRCPDEAVDSKVIRKRAQNRISQRCARERKVAQGRNMSTFMELLNKTRAGGKEGDAVLVNAYMELMQENERLNDALLRMRKKLLSISNNAAAAADDSIFKTLLKKSGKCRSDDMRGKEQSPTASESDPEVLSDQPQICTSNDSTDMYATTESELCPAGSVLESFDMSLNSVQGWSFDELLGDRIGQESNKIEGLENLFAPVIDNDLLFLQEMNAVDYCPPRVEDRADHSNFAQLYMTIPVNHPLDSMYGMDGKMSPVQLCNAVEAAGVMYICQQFGIPFDRSMFTGPASLSRFKSQYLHRVSPQVLNRLADVSVHLMATYSGLNDYVCALTAREMMVAVMRWRLCPSKANAEALPGEFRPTRLQAALDYPLAIDMINWPSVRDGLIMLSRTEGPAAVDGLIHELVLNTVFDVPQLQLSLNTLDAFYNIIGRSTGSLPMSRQELLRKLEGGSARNAQSHRSRSLIGQLWLDISIKMANSGGNGDICDPDLAVPNSSLALARQLGADQVLKWRLDASWHPRNPHLGCGTVSVATYPTVPALSLNA